MKTLMKITTGLKSLDEVCDGLRLGDNVVWQVDSLYDYEQFVLAFAASALKDGRRIAYIRFATHEPLLAPHQYSVLYELDAQRGFEMFTTALHAIIAKEGLEVFYVFDCLSDLQSAWATDLMLGNFFSITCPYLYELDTITYFALLRNNHSFTTIARIRDTTQLLIEVYNTEHNSYIHPLKVLNRYSPTMFFPHLKKGEVFTPIINSIEATQLIRHIQKRGLESTLRILDYWDRIFLKAEDLVQISNDDAEKEEMVRQLCRMIMGRDEKILQLAQEYMTLDDFLEIKDHLIGTGFIGGKSVGMILARKILSKKDRSKWERLQEAHDSFYIGSDVFYTYIVHNGWWKLFMEHKTDEGYFSAAAQLRDLIPTGKFPDELKDKFRQLIEYYGQSPIIVRSSSLLEDAYGNAFAGKYESLFLVNQGPPETRFAEFSKAVKQIFASVMGDDALSYRVDKGLEKLDEQMGLLVMRVSGSYHDNCFFPDMAGVGLSYNHYIWNSCMEPGAGMLRHVVGLGTRAVNRSEGDYPRIIALDCPLMKPFSGIDDARKFSQRHIDVLNIAENRLETIEVADYFRNNQVAMSLIGKRDDAMAQRLRERGLPEEASWLVDFDEFIGKTPFVKDMQMILKMLEEIYRNPVDIEYTVNFTSEGNYRINLLQCRPQQARWRHDKVVLPESIDDDRLFFRSSGGFLGGNIASDIKWIVVIDPEGYSGLSESDKYTVARLIGQINRRMKNRREAAAMLMGPGRWGTTTPSLGVPVKYSEINNASVIVEIAFMRDDLIPEVSYGTHFFQDLVENDTYYIAISPGKEGVILNRAVLERFRNIAKELLPDEKRFHDVIAVYDADTLVRLLADTASQNVVCFAKGD
ncbi:MAG: phosphoenolpyruvate synthase [Spirochaetes bacterium]|nr:phosphoenolpyruvate synthase [Spirochaetota bacterium]